MHVTQSVKRYAQKLSKALSVRFNGVIKSALSLKVPSVFATLSGYLIDRFLIDRFLGTVESVEVVQPLQPIVAPLKDPVSETPLSYVVERGNGVSAMFYTGRIDGKLMNWINSKNASFDHESGTPLKVYPNNIRDDSLSPVLVEPQNWLICFEYTIVGTTKFEFRAMTDTLYRSWYMGPPGMDSKSLSGQVAYNRYQASNTTPSLELPNQSGPEHG